MKKICLVSLAILLTLPFASFSSAQEQEKGMFQALSIKPSVGFEYFSRTISWDENDKTSKLKSYFFTFSTEFEFQKGFFLSAIFGYSFSDYEGLEFRELPISLRIREDAESYAGFLLGGEIKKSIIYSNDLKIDGLAQFFYYFGTKDEREIPLDVEGTAEGDPNWKRFSIGPVLTYTGFDRFSPYLYLNFNKLWGKFKMDQKVQDLTKTENKKISGKSSFCTSLGLIYELTDAFGVKAEASLIPHKDGVDLGFIVKAMYTF